MEVRLIKAHTLVNKLLPIGHICSVTQGNGEALVDAGIGVDVTLQYQKKVKAAKKRQDKKIADLEKKQQAEEIEEVIEKVAENIIKKTTKK